MSGPGESRSRSQKPHGRRKHVPQRTCVVCRAVYSKRDLVRLVRTPERQLVIDKTGKQNGRGAYLCRQRSCWEGALTGHQLSKALKMTVGEDEKRVLLDAIEQESDPPSAAN